MIRILTDADEPAFRAFLEPRAASSMFLLSNARAAGFVDRGARFQATYAGAFDAGGVLIAVAAHAWNGMVLVQAPVDEPTLVAVATLAIATTGRDVTGFSGAADQVAVLRRAIPLPRTPALEAHEWLYAIAIADMQVPPALARGEVACRAPTVEEVPLLGAWRHAYAIETMNTPDTDEHRAQAQRVMASSVAAGATWVVEAHGALVAMTGFNARLPDIVQVGGVYTPPALRGRGHARAAVAGSLRDAQAAGATRAILFTKNVAAARAYEAIGFARIGDYALVLL